MLELRDFPLARVLELTQPFFAELGEAMAGRRIVLVPGNHDHRLAEPLLEELSLGGGSLGLEHRALPAGEALNRIGSWLGAAELSVAYPGVWLRDDVYATHGHYMDCHMTLPRLECVAAAAVMRSGRRPPEAAAPGDYERVLRPLYGFAFGLADGGLASWSEPALRARLALGRPIATPARSPRPRAKPLSASASQPASGRSTGCCVPTSRPTSPPLRSPATASPPRPSSRGGCESTPPT